MKYFVAAAVAASLLAGTAATAQPYDNRNNSQWNDNNRDRDGRNNRWDNNGRNDGWNRGRWQGDNRHQTRPRWSRGDRFSQYGHRGWVVSDYRSHRLRKPPRGYHWVQSNDEFLLVAITSGVIAQIILGNR